MVTESTVPDDSSAASDAAPSSDGRLAEKIGERELARVVIKITGVDELLELEGDDVDLGTDLKVRYKHRLVAEFRRDAVDGWWYKAIVLNEQPPFGGSGDARDAGDLSESSS